MGKDYLGKDMRRSGKADDKEEEKEFKALDEGDITLLKTYGQGQYSKPLKEVILLLFLKKLFIWCKKAATCKLNTTVILSVQKVENDIAEITKRVNELAGIKESDTGLGPPAMWDLAADKQTLQSEQPLQVARYSEGISNI